MWWTGGKDSAWALSELRADPTWDVRGLISLVNEKNGRAFLHGVRHDLLDRQAAALGLPLHLIPLDLTASTNDHVASIRQCLGELRSEGTEFVAFSDMFSNRRYERRQLAINGTGMEAVFPLWKRETSEHSAMLLESGVSARICAVDTSALSVNYLGRRFSSDLLAALPEGVDPCGENDEYHTFVEWAPGWGSQVSVEPTRTMEVYDFGFAELEPTSEAKAPTEAGLSGLSRAPAGVDVPGTRSDPFGYFERLARVRRYVDEHLGDDLSGAKIAKVAAMAPNAFTRYFRQHTGMTFAAWLLAHRVKRAEEILRKRDDYVTRVGELVGFRSERTFRRAFHRVTGCSPSQYRNRWLHGAKGSDGEHK